MNQLERTKQWFDIAVPNPSPKDKRVQIGCHIEEFAEMLDSLGYEETQELEIMTREADWFKGKSTMFYDKQDELVKYCDREALLDSLADQIVTAIGVAHMIGFDILGALEEVNRSNFSKFEDGKAVFDENGKITKGKHYSKPDLKPYV